jgi:hypothetical protein
MYSHLLYRLKNALIFPNCDHVFDRNFADREDVGSSFSETTLTTMSRSVMMPTGTRFASDCSITTKSPK